MPDPIHDPLLIGFQLGTMFLSVLTGLYLISLRRTAPLLQYEPRRAVPWGAAGSVLAITFLLLTFYTAARTFQVGKEHEEAFTAAHLVASMLAQVIVIGGFFFVIAVASHAKWSDLGLPGTTHDFAKDIFIGAVAALAALAPVLYSQKLFMSLLYPENKISGHALVKMLMSGKPDINLFLLSGIMAVVVAPICEEVTFRLLLQGWLEKLEDRRLARVSEVSDTPITGDEPRIASDPDIDVEPSSCEIQPSSPPALPSERGIAGLPRGWFPIIVSASAFGLAHYGYGPEPVPLFLLGLVLGYIYQRTHRIIPSIVAHALFNAFTMVTLWRMLFHAN
jgi:membrane protease YdiL (CAAX protease family)